MRVRLVGLCTAVALALAAVAAAGTTVEQFPFSAQFTNPCTGEDFYVEGVVHHRSNARISASGIFHSGEQFSFQGVSGWTDSGVRYVVPSANSLKTHVDLDGGRVLFTFVASQRFIRVGNDGQFVEGDDLTTHIVSKFRIDADGVVTMDTVDIEIECR